MKPAFLLLFGLSGVAFAQNAAVTKNPNTDRLTGDLVMPGGRTLFVEGTFKTGQFPAHLGRNEPDAWGNQIGFTSILASDAYHHGLIARTQGNAGIAVIGLSETGACAGKFVQSNSFASPAVYIGRDANSFPSAWPEYGSPSLVVSTPADSSITPVAEFRKNQTDVVLKIGSDGSVTAPLQRYSDTNALVTKSHADGSYLPLIGVTNGSNAANGRVGEYVTSTGASTSLVSTAAKTIHSITLLAGDWDVEGVATYTKPAATMVTYTQQGISTGNNVIGNTGTFTATAAGISDVIPSAFTTPVVRISVQVNTTVHLVARAGFTTSTLNATGFIRARRVR
jgi:hypothetical protein